MNIYFSISVQCTSPTVISATASVDATCREKVKRRKNTRQVYSRNFSLLSLCLFSWRWFHHYVNDNKEENVCTEDSDDSGNDNDDDEKKLPTNNPETWLSTPGRYALEGEMLEPMNSTVTVCQCQNEFIEKKS